MPLFGGEKPHTNRDVLDSLEHLTTTEAGQLLILPSTSRLIYESVNDKIGREGFNGKTFGEVMICYIGVGGFYDDRFGNLPYFTQTKIELKDRLDEKIKDEDYDRIRLEYEKPFHERMYNDVDGMVIVSDKFKGNEQALCDIRLGFQDAVNRRLKELAKPKFIADRLGDFRYDLNSTADILVETDFANILKFYEVVHKMEGGKAEETIKRVDGAILLDVPRNLNVDVKVVGRKADGPGKLDVNLQVDLRTGFSKYYEDVGYTGRAKVFWCDLTSETCKTLATFQNSYGRPKRIDEHHNATFRAYMQNLRDVFPKKLDMDEAIEFALRELEKPMGPPKTTNNRENNHSQAKLTEMVEKT